MFKVQLCQEAGDNAGSGGGAPPPAEGTAPPPPSSPPPATPDFNARLEKFMNEQARFNAQVADVIVNRRGDTAPPASAPPALDPALIDPDVAKLVNSQLAPLQQRLAAAEDNSDAMAARAYATEHGYEKEELIEAESLFQGWRKSNIPASRIDAMRYIRGTRSEKERAEARLEANKRRNEENSFGGAETPNRASRVTGLGDPEKMTARERSDKYWPAVLDKEGF